MRPSGKRLLATFVFCCGVSSAATLFQLGVRVMDPAGRSITQAQVQLLSESNSPVAVDPKVGHGVFQFRRRCNIFCVSCFGVG